MKTIAIITHKDGTVAPLDDFGKHYEAIKLYDMDRNGTHRALFPFDISAYDFDLREALHLTHVTDVVAQHYEEGQFEKLKDADLRLWLEAPGTTARDALLAFHDGRLPEAAIGAHAVQGAEGRVAHHEPTRTHRPWAQSNRVLTPTRGGQSLI